MKLMSCKAIAYAVLLHRALAIVFLYCGVIGKLQSEPISKWLGLIETFA